MRRRRATFRKCRRAARFGYLVSSKSKIDPRVLRGDVMTKKICGRVICSVVISAAILSGMSCAAPASAPTAADAKKFLDNVNDTMKRLEIEQNQAGWIAQTYITDDTEAISARVNLEVTDAIARFAKESTRFA